MRWGGDELAAWRIEGADGDGGWLRARGDEFTLESPDLDLPLTRLDRMLFRIRQEPAADAVRVQIEARFVGGDTFERDERVGFDLDADGTVQTHRIMVPDELRDGVRAIDRLRLRVLGRGAVAVESIELAPRKVSHRPGAPGEITAIQVLSHRRAGTHFLMESLERNFGVPLLKRGHGSSEITEIPPHHVGVYIVRDCRDVLVSNYEWWANSQESVAFGIAPKFRGCSIEDYVRGRLEIEVPDWRGIEGCGYLPTDYFADPVGFWAEHMRGFEGRERVAFLRYEDLKDDPERALRPVARLLGRDLGEVQAVEELTGFRPRKGVVGGWRRELSDELNDYVFSRVGDVMARWGYER